MGKRAKEKVTAISAPVFISIGRIEQEKKEKQQKLSACRKPCSKQDLATHSGESCWTLALIIQSSGCVKTRRRPVVSDAEQRLFPFMSF